MRGQLKNSVYMEKKLPYSPKRKESTSCRVGKSD